LNDDGSTVEPEFYVPIIPFCLVNGISGIGTGFSCDIPSYHPLTLVQYLKAKLNDQSTEHIDFIPYYEGFKGTVTKILDTKYQIRGKYEKVGEDKIRITELPVGTWTMPYLKHLEELIDGTVDKDGKKIPPVLKDMTNLSTELVVDITVQFPKGKLATLSGEAIDKLLGMTTSVSTTNMHLFDADCKLHKYTNVEEIIDDFCVTRRKTYQWRKDAQVADMRALLVRLLNRARYILDVLAGTVDLRKKTNQQVTELLESLTYDKIEGDYKYLIKMPMDSVTEEHVAKILQEKSDTEKELTILLATTIEQLWLKELNEFEIEYQSFMTKRTKIVKK
jgi:DNA topoisomerase-2